MRREIIGECTLYLGDCRELELTADCIVSDPPYGIAFQRGAGGKGKHRHSHCYAIAGDAEPFDPAPLFGRPCLLFGANHYHARLPAGGTFHAWDKSCGQGPADSFADVEFFWSSWKMKSLMLRHLWKGVLQASEKGAPKFHVSQKPVAVMVECVRAAAAWPIVCDPYMGSGSTGVACVRLGRPFVGVEIDEKHFDTACRRIAAAERQADMFVAKVEQLCL